jgi:hypothetical protein
MGPAQLTATLSTKAGPRTFVHATYRAPNSPPENPVRQPSFISGPRCAGRHKRQVMPHRAHARPADYRRLGLPSPLLHASIRIASDSATGPVMIRRISSGA